MNVKPNVNIGTIGHVDHGKTTLTAAIIHTLHKVYPAENSDVKIKGYSDIDNSPEERARGITIKQTTVHYYTPNRHYSHTDCPGHADYIKNMITGAAQMDVAILVVSAADGPNVQTTEHILLAKKVGVKHVITFLNKCDLADPEMVMLVEEETIGILKKYGFDDTIVIHGSALKALEETASGTQGQYMQVIVDMFKKIDEQIPLPPRAIDAPFLLSIDGVFSIKGRGTVATGVIERGVVNLNAELQIVPSPGKTDRTVITGIEAFNKPHSTASAGQNVGLLLRGIEASAVERGMVLCVPNTVKTYRSFYADVYVLSEEEGGRTKPFTNNYRPQIFVRTNDVTATILLEDRDIVKSGDHARMLFIFEKDVPIEPSLGFTIREGGRTVGSGIVGQVMDSRETETILAARSTKKAAS